MPWRKTKDAYSIWVSEVMLQQTQVSVVIPYYERWMTRFPSVGSLASASEEEVLQLWQGLGYYRRAKSLLSGAQYVLERGMPSDISGWRKVPGIGAYSAGAIASIAQELPVALVDGNVERVYARLLGDDSVGPKLTKAAWDWAEANICSEHPGDWNQGLMELGATVCTPKDPKCSGCPLQLECKGFLRGLVSELPAPSPKELVRDLTITFLILHHGGSLFFSRAKQGQWWSGMLVLPTPEDVPATEWTEDLGRFVFRVTNNRVKAEVKLIRLETAPQGFEEVPLERLQDVPIPAPHRKALKLLQRI
jgi:A/G-specific adenine glycosylase